MKYSYTFLLLLATLIIAGCSKPFDDSEIWDKLDEYESRIVKLEEVCKQTNTNISSLQAIVNAILEKDYVNDVTPITKDGVTIGYTITFTKSEPITIYHGTDGSTPAIGVGQDYDGNYYWTLNGDWLTNAEGNRIKVQGNDGISPQLKIENDYWYVSYDNGATWNMLDKATGENGDAFFESVSFDDEKVSFVLKDGTIIDIPRHVAKELDIVFEKTENIFCEPNSSTTLEFAITGGDVAQIHTIGENGWTGEIEIDNESHSGRIIIYAPEASVSGKILIFATDTFGHLIMKSLTFTDKLLETPTLSYNMIKAGGDFEVEVTTNLKYQIIIPSDATSWVSHKSTRAVRNETLCFRVSANNNTLGRSCEITIKSNDNSIVKTIMVYQEGDKYYSRGSGTKTDPYIVETIGQWENLSIMVANRNSFRNTYFKLGDNLDFRNASISPIGTESTAFSGIFDGNGHCIKNAKISGSKFLGLFGNIKNAVIQNFKIETITVSGSSYMGILSGYTSESTIKEISISGKIGSGSYIGGITGYADNSTIDCCKNDAWVGNTSSRYIGGITGYANISNISNCYNSGELFGTDCMGGIVGYLTEFSSVKNCQNGAQIMQNDLYSCTGGIVGYNCGAIYACTMNNSINGTAVLPSYKTIGTIVGYQHTGAVCQYCYYLKYGIINKNFTHCGDLNWGSWSNYGAFDIYGMTTYGYSVTTLLNEWVSINTSTAKPYKRWTGIFPMLEE